MNTLKNLDMSQLYYNSRETYIIISHKDGSQNRIKLFENFLEIYKVIKDYPIISFIWINPNKVSISDKLINWIKSEFTPLFDTDPFLWAASVQTAPIELRKHLIPFHKE